jgi:hypothetical protein
LVIDSKDYLFRYHTKQYFLRILFNGGFAADNIDISNFCYLST